MNINWSNSHTLLVGLPDKITVENIKSLISGIKEIEDVALIYDHFRAENYFLNRAYVLFKDEILDDDPIIKNPIDFCGNQVRFYNYLEDIQELEFFIFGLPCDINKTVIENTLRPYRFKKVVLHPSVSGEFCYAHVTFNRSRDRDIAFIKATRIPEAGYYLSHDSSYHVICIKGAGKDDQKKPKNPYIIKHGKTEYIVDKDKLSEISKKIPNSPIDLTTYSGDMQLFVNFLNGGTLTINENTIKFCMNLLDVFQIKNVNIKPTKEFFSFNNIVIFNNIFPENVISRSDIVSFIMTNLPRLTHNGRIRNIHPSVISSIHELNNKNKSKQQFTQEYLLKLVKNSPSSHKHLLIEHIDLDSLSTSSIISLLKDEKININNFRKKLMLFFKSLKALPEYVTIKPDENNPLLGVFEYFNKRDKGNPFFTGTIGIETSSTHVGQVCEIVDHVTKTIFSTNDYENSWIKVEFMKDEIALTGYVFQSTDGSGRGHMRSWDLLGSNDGVNWSLVDSVKNSKELKEKGIFIKTFPQTQFYRYVRVTQTSQNSLEHYNLCLNHFDVFGALRERE